MSESQGEKISVAEFAKRRGVTSQQILHYMNAGYFGDAVRDVRRAGAKRPRWEIDFTRAVENLDKWLNKMNPATARNKAKAERRAKARLAGRDPDEEEDGAPEPDDPATPLDDAKKYAASRARREEALAQIAELDLQEKAGKLVSVDGVKADAAKLARRVRDALMVIPVEVAAQIASMKDAHAIEQLLQDRLLNALRDLRP